MHFFKDKIPVFFPFHNSTITFAPHQAFPPMEEEKKARGVFWLLTAVSITGMILLLIFQPQWVWISFPFVGTFFANAMNVI